MKSINLLSNIDWKMNEVLIVSRLKMSKKRLKVQYKILIAYSAPRIGIRKDDVLFAPRAF